MVKVQRAIASTRPEVGCMIKSTPEMMPSAIPTAASLNVGSASQISRGRGYATNQPAKDNQNTIVTTPKMESRAPRGHIAKIPGRGGSIRLLGRFVMAFLEP